MTNKPNNMPDGFEVGDTLALPSLSIKGVKEGESLYVQFIGPMQTRAQTDNEGKPKVENGKSVTITTAPVVDLVTGQEGEMVVGYTAKKGIERVDDYQDKAFMLTRGPKRNRTVEWAVKELRAKSK